VGLVVAIWLVVPGVWFVRNIFISGNPLGTALWMPIEGTDLFPNETLWAQMQPDLSRMTVKKPVGVLLRNFRFWLERWPVVSGGLVPACFFVVGLLHRFRRTRAEALKWWTGGALVVAIAGGGMGAVRDYSAYEPGNMAVLFAPVVALFGAAVLLVLLERAQIEIVELRRGLLGLVVALNALPLVLTILPPKEPPVCWPPYFGQIVRLVGGFFDEKEVVASDIPEAVAWYGDRSSLMVPPTVKQFNEINDFVLTGATKGLLFSPVTLDGRLFTEVLSGAGREWAGLYLQRRVPDLFPLRSGTALPPRLGDMFGYLLYADSPRWQKFVPQTPAGAAAPAGNSSAPGGGAQAPAGGEAPRPKAGGGNP
jgi:hypothetical protein